MYCTGNSMDNLLSDCGLVNAKISASEKDLPVNFIVQGFEFLQNFSFFSERKSERIKRK